MQKTSSTNFTLHSAESGFPDLGDITSEQLRDDLAYVLPRLMSTLPQKPRNF